MQPDEILPDLEEDILEDDPDDLDIEDDEEYDD